MRFFSCKHPAAALHVYSGEVTVVQNERFPEYETVTYNLYCRDCGEPVKVGYSRLKPEIAAADKARHEQVMAESKKCLEESRAARAVRAAASIGPTP